MLTPMVAAEPPIVRVRVFVLAGQSNMQGHGAVTTMDWLGEDPEYGHLLATVKDQSGVFRTRDDVFVIYPRREDDIKSGFLTAGFGARDDRIGPELMFGHVLGDRLAEPALLIKAAWGGRSLAEDFRPPSAGGEAGETYTEMLDVVRSSLRRAAEEAPFGADARLELAGFVWFQGWNDMIDREKVDQYEKNLTSLIRDVRRDLDAPGLPFVVAELGVGGPAAAEENERMADIRRAQAAPASMDEFRGNVGYVASSAYWDRVAADFLAEHWVRRVWDSPESKAEFERMGSQPPYHYLGSAKVYSLIGYAMAEEMLKLIGD